MEGISDEALARLTQQTSYQRSTYLSARIEADGRDNGVVSQHRVAVNVLEELYASPGTASRLGIALTGDPALFSDEDVLFGHPDYSVIRRLVTEELGEKIKRGELRRTDILNVGGGCINAQRF